MSKLWLPTCPATGKRSFKAYRPAAKFARKIDPESQVYRCPKCGYFHISSMTAEEYDRRQARGRSA